MTQGHKRAFVAPLSQGRRTHTDQFGPEQKLVRRPPCSGVSQPGRAGRIQPPNARSDLPSTRPTLASPFTQGVKGEYKAATESKRH